MRRLLTALMILLVVVVAGLSSLIVLVNPNDFRDDLARPAAAHGYQLTLDDNLRWHVWPQLSILTGHISLTAQGASQPLVNAENMRLDVEFWPLLSRRLQVSQVVLKNAVIQFSDQTRPQRPPLAPVAPADSSPPPPEQGWGFSVASLRIADSILVLQSARGGILTLRDLNLSLKQNDQYQGQMALSARLNRNQRDLTLSLEADLDAMSFPWRWQARINRLNYQLGGANLPAAGIQGEASAGLDWQSAPRRLTLSQLRLSANDSQIQGQASVLLEDQPVWQIGLQAERLDLDQLLLATAVKQGDAGAVAARVPAPVIVSLPATDYQQLRGFSGELSFRASQLRWRGLHFNQVNAHISNQAGLVKISQLQGQLNGGEISLPGSLHATEKPARFRFSPQLQNVPVAPLLQAFGYPVPFSGRLNLRGEFSGSPLNAQAFRQLWQGQAALSLQDMRVEGLNIQQLIAYSLADGKASAPITDNASVFQQFSATATLNNGKLTLEPLQGQAAGFSLQGTAALDLSAQICDAQFAIALQPDFYSGNHLPPLVKNTPIPLRIYGDWDALNYQFQPDQRLQDSLRDEARKRLNDWIRQQRARP